MDNLLQDCVLLLAESDLGRLARHTFLLLKTGMGNIAVIRREEGIFVEERPGKLRHLGNKKP
jgi:hypothetical protein